MRSLITSRSGEDASTATVEILLKYVRVGLLLICDESTEESLKVLSVAMSRVGVSSVVWLLLDPETSEIFSVAVAVGVSDEVGLLVAAIRVIVSACEIVVLIMLNLVSSLNPASSCEVRWGLDIILFIV